MGGTLPPKRVHGSFANLRLDRLRFTLSAVNGVLCADAIVLT